MSRRVLLVGRDGPNLDGSYARALRALGWHVTFFDMGARIDKHTRFDRAGKLINRFVPVESWFRKANRELFVHVKESAPDMVIVVGKQGVRAGALAQMKVAVPDTEFVFMWPDPMFTLEPATHAALSVYDLVVTYSDRARPMLERLGARRTLWLPFAADFDLHPKEVSVTTEDRGRFACDVLFVGNHRPEREAAIVALLDAGLRVRVFGTKIWRDHARDRARVDAYFEGRILRGEEYVKASRCASVSINVVDPGNYPAANMRFFENFAAGAPTVNSSCPEMEEAFPDGVATLYFDDHAGLVQRVRELLGDADRRRQIADEGAARVSAGHTYSHRATKLVAALGG